jgi:hypothetical protein
MTLDVLKVSCTCQETVAQRCNKKGRYYKSRKLNHCSGASKLMDFVSYDSQNVSSWVLITDQIDEFGLSVKAPLPWFIFLMIAAVDLHQVIGPTNKHKIKVPTMSPIVPHY